jgi:TolB-like protein/Tfp pilus assembly protein PilF
MAQEKNIKSFISNPLVQTFLIYVSGGWIVLEMTDYFITNYRLDETFRDILLIIMLAGLPVALFLSWYLSRDKPEEEDDLKVVPEKKAPGFFKVMLKWPWFSIPGTVMFILIVVSLIRLVYRHSASITDNLALSGAEISLAVLPFTNYTGDTEQEWMVAGQHETLINELSKISQVRPLRVISRSTVNAFKNYDKPVPEIAKEINVEYLVEASVLGFGDSITLQLRLIQVYPEENVVWTESCSSDFTNVLNLHSDIAGQIAEKMNLKLTTDDLDRLSIPRQVNPDSYKAYLRGMYHLNQLTHESIQKGLEYLHEAVRIDPAEPFAHAGLALGYLEIAHGPLGTGDDLAKAEAAALQALKLDTTMAEVHTALGEVYLYKLWEFDKAERHLIRAIEKNPNLAMAHYHYAWALYLWDRMEEAIYEHKLALKYDPFNPLHTAWLGALYCYDEQYEEAIRCANEALEIQKDYVVSYYVLGITHLETGRMDEAIEAHQKLAELAPLWSWQLGLTYVAAGQYEEAEKILDEFEKKPIIPFTAHGRTVLNAALGRYDEAFKWLDYEPHHAWTAWAAVMPEGKGLRDDPRYQDFLERLNLPD